MFDYWPDGKVFYKLAKNYSQEQRMVLAQSFGKVFQGSREKLDHLFTYLSYFFSNFHGSSLLIIKRDKK